MVGNAALRRTVALGLHMPGFLFCLGLHMAWFADVPAKVVLLGHRSSALRQPRK